MTQRIEEMLKSKEQLMLDVSHELRSPLSTIHEQLALVLSDMVSGAGGQEQHQFAGHPRQPGADMLDHPCPARCTVPHAQHAQRHRQAQ